MDELEFASACFDERREELRETLKSLTARIGTEAHPCYWQRLQSAGIGAIEFVPNSDEVDAPSLKDFVFNDLLDAPEEIDLETVWAGVEEIYIDSNVWEPDHAGARADELYHFGQ